MKPATGKSGSKPVYGGPGGRGCVHAPERIGFIIDRIEALSYRMGYDLSTGKGTVVLNVTLVPAASIEQAARLLSKTFASPFVMSSRILLRAEGGSIGGVVVPRGMVGVGTLCSVTINGILLKHGVPVHSKYAGVLEMRGGERSRFTSLISYAGCTLDPLPIFIRGGMTSAGTYLRGGAGRLLASFREIPAVCVELAHDIRLQMQNAGMHGILAIGAPNKPLYEMPVGMDMAGLVVVGGLNSIAFLHEQGIPTESFAMSVLEEYEKLVDYRHAFRDFLGRRI